MVHKIWKYIDVMGISCDSVNPLTNYIHGRLPVGSVKPVSNLEKIYMINDVCKKMNILFKINTVVSSVNKHELLSPLINLLNVHRWKIFQLLEIKNENGGKIEGLKVSDEDYKNYIDNNKKLLINKKS